MTVETLNRCDVERLAQDLSAKVLAKRAIIEQAQGKIVLEAFRKGPGWEIKLTTSM